MKIDIAKWMQTAANFGVIAGIAFLGYELRQNNELLESQIDSTRQGIRTNDMLSPLEYPDLAEALIRLEHGEALSDYEQLILNRSVSAMLYNWQFVYTEYRQGRIAEGSLPITAWRGAFNGRQLAQGWPDLREYWDANKDLAFDPRFVQWMDENIVGH